MIIWSDTLTSEQIDDAAAKARVNVFDAALSLRANKRAKRWTIYLSGDSPYVNGHDSSRPAATWDQWGIFLNALFETDPNMTTANYKDRDTFHAITDDRFATLTYEQSHRRHDWRWMPIGRVPHYACNGCTAEMWPKARPYNDARYAEFEEALS